MQGLKVPQTIKTAKLNAVVPSRQSISWWDSRRLVDEAFEQIGFSSKRIKEYNQTKRGADVEVDIAWDKTELAEEITTEIVSGKLQRTGDHNLSITDISDPLDTCKLKDRHASLAEPLLAATAAGAAMEPLHKVCSCLCDEEVQHLEHASSAIAD